MRMPLLLALTLVCSLHWLLDMSVEKPGGYRNGSFMSSTNALLLLEELNMRNNLLARNGDNGNVTTLDLSWQARLKVWMYKEQE